jgi:AmmeMemoRadiSam system protein A
MLTDDSNSAKQGKRLLGLARATISSALGKPVVTTSQTLEDREESRELGACFVTLTQHGQLRGCIGSLNAHRPLEVDLKVNAVAAALQDVRFARLTLAELEATDIEVSVLSSLETIHFSNEIDALAQLRPGVDGVVFEFRHSRSTFLPQVWEQLPNAQLFIAHLKQKAGLPPNFWSPDIRLQRYTVSKFREQSRA